MSTETPLRRLYFLLMVGSLILAMASTAMVFLPLFDVMGRLGVGVVAAACWLGVPIGFRLWRRTSPHALVGDNPENVTPREQIGYNWILMVVVIIVTSSLTIFITNDLNRLEAGVVRSVQIWKPVAILYNTCGYWPAVLLTPLLGVVCVGAMAVKIRKLMAQSRQDAADRDSANIQDTADPR
jgi:hypothetical protein